MVLAALLTGAGALGAVALAPAGDGTAAGGAVAAKPPRPARPDCTAPEFHQFDFWIGDWSVTSGGAQAGTNLVTVEEDGCVIHEHWKGSRGGTGQSFTFYSRVTGKWKQLWIDNGGNPAELEGTYKDGVLALASEVKGADGKVALSKLTFFDNKADRTVRQLWESSNDEGKTWQVMFDGLYSRKP
ncbi:MAG TPA: hypothetical protein VE404_10285 [Verrucomicrobiae bacterium]|nr:hypothetical protein [Verrucomicrobiae bacterium]